MLDAEMLVVAQQVRHSAELPRQYNRNPNNPNNPSNPRSEEHTSELQSQFHLVCRLLLEKKNNNRQESSGTSSTLWSTSEMWPLAVSSTRSNTASSVRRRAPRGPTRSTSCPPWIRLSTLP